jgi:transposase
MHEAKKGNRCRKQMDGQGQRQSAKAHLVAVMQQGYSYQAATVLAGIQVSQSTAYRLCQGVRKQGEAALQDGRHGHPSKLRGAARTFLEEQCRQAPSMPSSVIQKLLHEGFGLSVSISQINRVRAALGISNHQQKQGQEKKLKQKQPSPLKQSGRKAQEASCCLLLLIKRASSHP